MKQFIVLVATVMLGLLLFNMIAGSGEKSVYSSVKKLWQAELSSRAAEDPVINPGL